MVSDSRIERLKGQVCFDNPGLGEIGIISYENYGTESSEFWNSLESRINDLNYISISLKDESASLDLACTIFMYAIKKRRNGVTEPEEESLLMLAKMEHLRYSRYLTAHGYSYGEEDDDVFNTNHQICSWEELREEDRKYHLDMVKAQLKVIE